ncbi:hypothetical protein [Streptomyces sp. NPDC057910]|uniref:hypothetical protein n=1 Tax=Streptomyces sp. NPDC057910 TaxID=3346278 RepID=UPI0036EEC514
MDENPQHEFWTVGRLRDALAAYDADTELHIEVPDDDPVDGYGVIGIGFGRGYQPPFGERGKDLDELTDDDWEQDPFLSIELAQRTMPWD